MLIEINYTYKKKNWKINPLKYYLPFEMSHNLRVLSAAPVRSIVLCQFTSKHHTAPWCPMKFPNLSPFNENQTLGWWSLAEENNRSPSLLYFICVMARSCPWSISGFCEINDKTLTIKIRFESGEVLFRINYSNYARKTHHI